MLISPSDRKARFDDIIQKIVSGNFDKLPPALLDFARDFSDCDDHEERIDTIILQCGAFNRDKKQHLDGILGKEAFDVITQKVFRVMLKTIREIDKEPCI
jgi:hypothetical protein